jgi:hypothetical protein
LLPENFFRINDIFQLSLAKFAYSVFVSLSALAEQIIVSNVDQSDWLERKAEQKLLTLFVSLNLSRTLQGML